MEVRGGEGRGREGRRGEGRRKEKDSLKQTDHRWALKEIPPIQQPCPLWSDLQHLK